MAGCTGTPTSPTATPAPASGITITPLPAGSNTPATVSHDVWGRVTVGNKSYSGWAVTVNSNGKDYIGYTNATGDFAVNITTAPNVNEYMLSVYDSSRQTVYQDSEPRHFDNNPVNIKLG